MKRREAKFEWAYFSDDGYISPNDLNNILDQLGYRLVGFGKRPDLGERWCFVQIDSEFDVMKPVYHTKDV